MKKSVSPQERQEQIAQLVLEQGMVTVEILAGRLGVSRMTIHRDLDELENRRVLRKIRNGATAQPSSMFESNFRYRLGQQIREKEAIARLAVNYIEPGQVVMLDDSSTALCLARLLPQVEPLTVITHSLPMVQALSEQANIRLIGLGGEYQQRFESFSGPICEAAMANLWSDICFLSAAGSKDGVTFHPDSQVVRIKRTMLAQSRQKILLLDHTKFGRAGLHQMARLSEFDCVIVDSEIPSEILDELHAAGIPVEVAPVSS